MCNTCEILKSLHKNLDADMFYKLAKVLLETEECNVTECGIQLDYEIDRLHNYDSPCSGCPNYNPNQPNICHCILPTLRQHTWTIK